MIYFTSSRRFRTEWRQKNKKKVSGNVKYAALNWFSDYFESRSQYVDIDSNYSAPLPSSLGVIQGSNFGPVFSNVYLNDPYKIL